MTIRVLALVGVLVVGVAALAGAAYVLTRSSDEPAATARPGLGALEVGILSAYGERTGRVAHSVSCAEAPDSDDLSCVVAYDDEGAARSTTLTVTCDDDGCVWRDDGELVGAG